MSQATRASAPVDQNDPVFKYLLASPGPAPNVSDYNVQVALGVLKKAADVATTETDGKRWVPGLSIVVIGRRNQELLCEGYGTTRVDGGTTIGSNTLFPCASLSKPVATTLLAHAGVPRTLGSGQEDPWAVSVGYTLVDESDRTKELGTTLRQWLSHRSGLPDHAGDLIEDLNPSIAQDALITALLEHQTGIRPKSFKYTNAGFTLGCLGAMKKIGAGSDWEIASARWLDELGMSRSTYRFTHASDDPKADRAFPHVGQPTATNTLRDVNRSRWTWRVAGREEERNPRLQAPAGGLISCARDLGQFLIRHLDTGFIEYPPANPPAEDLADNHPYSLGWNVKNPGGRDVSFSHSGAFRLGAATSMRFDPLSGFGIAVLSNGEPTGVPEALVTLFFNELYGHQLPTVDDFAGLFAVLRALMMSELYPVKIDNYDRYHGQPSETPGNLPAGQVVFDGYSPYYASRIAIERKGGDLVLKLGNGGNGSPLWERPLRCIEARTLTFVYETRGENEVGWSPVRLVQENGAIVRIIDTWLNSSGPGLGEIAAR
jgi:CubicO group peptidase (beta-lactamase class C family)